jgi:predicted short-subunit dehydrogenase-like oxidoreductase (DUF2520 family)
MGTALANAMRQAAFEVAGPLGRGADLSRAELVILCVPDAQIAGAAAHCPTRAMLAHCSGATTLAPLAPHDAFSLHPLLTVTKATKSLAGAGCAITATSPRAREIALCLANALELRPFEISDELRPLYHAAASAASNYIVTVASYAERLAATAGVQRDLLAPLVLAAATNWTREGSTALTGPVARGDEATVGLQRSAVARHAPDSLALWDALVAATRDVAAHNAARTAGDAALNTEGSS